MPRGIPNKPRKSAAKKTVRQAALKKPAKKAAKKVVKKTAKRAYTRKPKTVDTLRRAVDESQDFAGKPDVEVEGSIDSIGEAFRQAFEGAVNSADNGQFSASGMLDMGVRDRVGEARGGVVASVRKMVNAGIALELGANNSISERDVLTARQRLAVAEFELAIDKLETAIRG